MRLRRATPWVLCAVSLGLLALSIVLRVRYPAPAEDVTGLEAFIEPLGFVGIPVVGALIAVRLPANPYGWVWCALGLTSGLAEAGGPLARVAGWPTWVAWLLGGWGFVGLLGLSFFVFALFPTGTLPSRRWRWLARVDVAGALALFLLVPFVYDLSHPNPTPWAVQGDAGRRLVDGVVVSVYVMFFFVVLATVSLVLRFRRADQVERRQLTWFMYAAVLNGLIIVLDPLGLFPGGLAGTALNSAGFLLLPIAVAAAMLRYRLFEIDRIVSRTVSYGLLTGCLVVLYLVLVALLRALLEPLTGSSTVAVAVSTLAVAAVFNPVRRRLQAAVDRRFDRARYDAGQAVEAFAARLRNQVDLDQITEGLYETVSSTVTPGRMAVWLRDVPSVTERSS
jgi:hypothetical protein